MTERYSLSDRQVYGAEDDFEMDMILAAIDRALEDPEPAKRSTRGAARTNPAEAATVSDECTKTPFRTQAAARQALAEWKAARPEDPHVPHRVYPCDRCDGWHLTRKSSGRRVPPWDKNPEWERPASALAKLQRRFTE